MTDAEIIAKYKTIYNKINKKHMFQSYPLANTGGWAICYKGAACIFFAYKGEIIGAYEQQRGIIYIFKHFGKNTNTFISKCRSYIKSVENDWPETEYLY